MPSRPFLSRSIQELEAEFSERAQSRVLLAQLSHELSFRKTQRALILARKVSAELAKVKQRPRKKPAGVEGERLVDLDLDFTPELEPENYHSLASTLDAKSEFNRVDAAILVRDGAGTDWTNWDLESFDIEVDDAHAGKRREPKRTTGRSSPRSNLQSFLRKLLRFLK